MTQRSSCSKVSSSKLATWVFNISLLVALLVNGSRALGQADAGVTGTITDNTGAVVGGASITITNEATSVAQHVVSGSAGTYTVRGLLPGSYSIEVDAKGFSRSLKRGVLVEVSTTGTIDFNVQTGSTAETVEVSADQISLNTTQPQLGSTIDPAVIDSLPVEVSGRGRQIDSLQFLAPGTTGNTFSHRTSGGVDFEQEILYNGIPAPQPETEGNTGNFNPPYELIQEVRVERSTFAAQFGLGQGALTYQTKSGGNRYHGDLFEINRNNLFDSVGFFNGPAFGGSNRPPTDHENNYGFTVNGPISIPHLYNGKDRTFFQYSQEWFKQNEADTAISTVPTALEKTGNFSDFVDSGTGKLIPIYDPQTGLPFPGNIIPAGRISKNSASLLADIPNPDHPGTGIGGLNSNIAAAPNAIPNIQHVFGFTIDQKLTDRQSLHYTEWRNSYTTATFINNPFVVAPNPLSSLETEPTLGSVYLLNYSNALTSHLAVTAGLGWVGEINDQFDALTGINFPAIAQSTVLPTIAFDGPNAPTNWGGGSVASVNRKLGIALVNNWLWTKGRHTFNIGGEFRRTYQDNTFNNTSGAFNFSQRTTSVPNPGDPNFGNYGSAFASYLLGLPDSVNRAGNQEEKLRNVDLSPYIQDDIKLTPHLTVNLGLRWDIQVPFTENNNQIVFLNPNATDPAAVSLTGQPIAGAANQFGYGFPGAAGYNHAQTHFGHFGPRFGFAYELNQKTVIQGGFSLAFLDGGAYEYGTNKVAINNGQLLTGLFNRARTGSNVSSYGSWDTQVLPLVQPTPFSPGLGGGEQIEAFDPIHDGFAPYSQQWVINLQRQLPFKTFLTASWVGNRVIHLPSQLNAPNQLNPQYLSLGSKLSDVFAPGQTQLDGVNLPYTNFVNDFGGGATVAQALVPFPQYSNVFNNFEGSGTTYYQSLQVELDKRLSNGLSFLVGYTLSHLLDNNGSGFSSFAAGALNKYNQKPEYVVSGADEPQTLKISGSYELPIGPKKRFFNNHGVTGQVLGGWQVGFITDYEAGTPIGVGENGSPYPNGFNRPNRNQAIPLKTGSYSQVRALFLGKTTVAQIFNPAAFTATPTQYVLGDALRDYGELRYPNAYTENANARKKFFFGERFTGILQIDYFNLLNRTYFSGPNTNISNGAFGQVTGTGSGQRQGQAQFRLEF